MSRSVVELLDLSRLSKPGGPPNPTDIVATMRWGRAKITLVEGTQNQPLVVILSRALPVDVYVEFTTFGGSTATRDVDYTFNNLGQHPTVSGPDFIRIPAGSLNGFCNVSVPVEGGAEPAEFVDLKLQIYIEPYLAGSITLIPATGLETLRVAISEAPAAPPGSVFWSFETDEYAFNEDALPTSTRVRVNFTAPIPGDVVMRFWTTNGTATGGATPLTPGADYVTIDAQGTITAGTTTFSIPLQIINDLTVEGDEDFDVHGEVLTPGSLVVDGTTVSTTITINASDNPTPQNLIADWGEEETLARIVEGAPTARFRIRLSGVTTQNYQLPVTLTAISGDLQRLIVQTQGGVFGLASINANQTFTDVFITVPLRAGVQADMEYALTIGSVPGIAAGMNDTLSIIIRDAGSELPRIAFRDPVQPATTEGAASDVIITIEVENGLTANLASPWSVGLEYDSSGGAVYGPAPGDYRIFQVIGGQTVESPSVVNFAPFQSVATILLRTTPDSVSESVEEYRIRLVSPVGCTIGAQDETTGQIIDDDVGPGQGVLRPQFYFQSEVFGRGPNEVAGNQANMIVDLGPNVSYPTDVTITVAAYSPNATEGVHFDFPDGHDVVITGGNRYGKLRFRALAPGVATSLKWVVVEMVFIDPLDGSLDDYEQQVRWVAVLCGATDNRRLVPPVVTPLEALDDYKVYSNRIEEWSPEHRVSPGVPFVINLPYSNIQAGLLTRYSTDPNFLNAIVGGGNERWNGVAIAAHLAQELWLKRNNPVGRTFGTRHVFRSGIAAQEEIHWIKPHIKWLAADGAAGANPVYISVFEQDINGPHELAFAGSFDSPLFGAPGTVMWGRHLPTGNSGIAHPSCTRDLYITSRTHKHRFRYVNFGAYGVNFNSPSPGVERWHKAAFMDNVHLSGFQIHTDDIQTFAPVLGIFPPRYTKLWRVTHGLVHLDQWEWTNPSYLTSNSGLHFQFRPEHPCSWIVTNCLGTRSQNQMFYLDAPGPICIIANNTLSVGTGRAFCQIVSRPPHSTLPVSQMPNSGRNSGGPSHGLLAFVENEIWGNRAWGTASDFDIYGHSGELYFAGNLHRGHAGSGAGGQYNRRLYALLCHSDADGNYCFDGALADLACEYHPDSPVPPVTVFPAGPERFYMFRYVEIDGMDVAMDGTLPGWSAWPIVVSGCFRFTFLPVTQATATPSLGVEPFIVFNPIPWGTFPAYSSGAVLDDPLVRPVLGGPYGPNEAKPNRGGFSTALDGAIRFPSGFDVSIGVACGSGRLANHYRFLTGFAFDPPNPPLIPAPVPFSALTPAARDAYDGTDP